MNLNVLNCDNPSCGGGGDLAADKLLLNGAAPSKNEPKNTKNFWDSMLASRER